ncbi:hypothetical protein J4440_03450 [Candidatus Woesearchaeota archaeon]|nr:hypothetical protein [Candidatus Woesearchaeota archaeon]
MQTKEQNLGSLYVNLGLEDRVLANGVLPKKQLTERADIINGMVNTLAEKGRLNEAIKLIHDNPTARVLFTGNQDEIYRKAAENFSVSDKGEDEDHYSDAFEFIELLNKAEKNDLLYSLALREDLPYVVSMKALGTVRKNIGEEKFIETTNNTALRIQNNNPRAAYNLFLKTGNNSAIDNLHNYLMENFSFDNLHILRWTVRHSQEKVESLVNKVLSLNEANPATGKQFEGLGKFLFDLVYESGVKLNDDLQAKVDDLAVRNLRNYDVTLDNIKYKRLGVKWAKANFKHEPIEAYKILSANNYSGDEIIEAAMLAFIKRQSRGDGHEKLEIKVEHVKAFYPRLPKKTPLEVREEVASIAEDKEELAKISTLYRRKGDFSKAYELRYKSGKFDVKNDRTLMNLRSELIDEEIKDKDERVYCFWLIDADNVGYEFAFNRLLKNKPASAYNLAKGRSDNDRLSSARQEILKRNNPENSYKFFKSEKDETGIEMSLGVLSKKYRIDKQELIEFLNIK